MIPALAEGGRSFKGAAAYYLHDKRQKGQTAADTADRVAWTETVNLATDKPDRAWRMMAHTAMSQAELKAAAGVKATGRKLTKPVMAYSLSWHPDERPDRAEQMKAARATLTAMGLDGHQALIVCHNDEPHPHIHILVIREEDRRTDAMTMFYSLFSSRQRHEVFYHTQLRERRDTAKQISRKILAAMRRIDRETGQHQAKARTEYLKQCGQLRTSQDSQAAGLKAAWKSRNAERRTTLAPLRAKAAQMRQGQQQGRGRSIRDDDRYRRPPPPKTGPGLS